MAFKTVALALLCLLAIVSESFFENCVSKLVTRQQNNKVLELQPLHNIRNYKINNREG
jgi:hypothetical protein